MATTTNAPSASLADLSIEQLMNESVTSVSKKQTKLGQSPAAVTVVTQDEIRRLGINVGAAERAGLRTSAQLQKLARKVHRGNQG